MPCYVVTVRSSRVVRFTDEVEVDAPDPGTARRLATEKAAKDLAERDRVGGEEVERTYWAGDDDVREFPVDPPAGG
jgi:hypothetical protein